jgi:hypothetical protein
VTRRSRPSSVPDATSTMQSQAEVQASHGDLQTTRSASEFSAKPLGIVTAATATPSAEVESIAELTPQSTVAPPPHTSDPLDPSLISESSWFSSFRMLTLPPKPTRSGHRAASSDPTLSETAPQPIPVRHLRDIGPPQPQAQSLPTSSIAIEAVVTPQSAPTSPTRSSHRLTAPQVLPPANRPTQSFPTSESLLSSSSPSSLNFPTLRHSLPLPLLGQRKTKLKDFPPPSPASQQDNVWTTSLHEPLTDSPLVEPPVKAVDRDPNSVIQGERIAFHI